ncbi:MAG: hypothetical protein WC910_10315 [Bacteroidales bacterium]|jgi:hypothetical protein
MSELLKLYRNAQRPYEKFIRYCAIAPVGILPYYDGLLDQYSEADQIFVKRVLELEAKYSALTARIAELEERLELCESALTSMVYQFFYQPELGVLAHSFMSAEEEACEYLIKYGIAHWSNERKNSIVFDEVQELPKECEE